MMKDPDSTLWEQIASFEIGESEAPLSYTARLARENDWLPEYAARVVEEYRRFLFLVSQSDHPVTPSEEIDQAWHLHLLYTRSYWTELCGEILERPLHHHPTTGGLSQGDVFWRQYEETLASYEVHFGEPPPADIWPPPEQRFQSPSSRWVDTSRHWIIGKPRWWRPLRWPLLQKKMPGRLAIFALLGFGAFLSGCLKPSRGYLKMDGEEFLLLYVGLIPLAFLVSWLLVRVLRGKSGASEPLTDPFELALLGGGGMRAVDVALTQLFGLGWIEVVRKSKKTRDRIRRLAGIDSGEARGFEKTVIDALPEGKTVRIPDLRRSVSPAIEELQGRLRQAGLLLDSGQMASIRLVSILPFLALGGFGVTRLLTGLSNDKPVGFLLFLLILTLVMTCFRGFLQNRRTSLGEARWRATQRERRQSQPSLSGATAADNVGQAALAVALVGPGALDGIPGYADFSLTMKQPGNSSAGQTGGCGSGCDTGSDGGGGCGGGGCGGCGGCGG